MKRMISLLLAAGFLLSMVGCGADKGGSTEAQQSNMGFGTAVTAEGGEAAGSAAEAEPQVEQGTVQDGRYENQSLGIEVALDEGWTYTNEAQPEQQTGETAEAPADEAETAQTEPADQFYDMEATNADGSSISVQVQQMEKVFGGQLTPEQYADLISQSLEDDLAFEGITDVTWEQNTVTFAGQECTGLYISGTKDGGAYFCQRAFLVQDGYLVDVSVVSLGEDSTATLMASFSAA